MDPAGGTVGSRTAKAAEAEPQAPSPAVAYAVGKLRSSYEDLVSKPSADTGVMVMAAIAVIELEEQGRFDELREGDPPKLTRHDGNVTEVTTMAPWGNRRYVLLRHEYPEYFDASQVAAEGKTEDFPFPPSLGKTDLAERIAKRAEAVLARYPSKAR